MKNKPFFVVETGLEKLLRAKKEMKKAKEMKEVEKVIKAFCKEKGYKVVKK